MTRPIQCSFALGLLSLGLSAASNLVAQQQYTPGPQQPASSPAQAPQPRHASVVYRDGMLTVDASDASLNGILREIARSTGMKISGAVPEDRVFGTYGPADPQRILSSLLDGTGTNILIVSNAADRPTELLLTPRSGRPTPPNPNANQEADNADEPHPPADFQPSPQPPQPQRPFRAGLPRQTNAPSDPAAGTAPSQVSQPVVFPSISPTTPAATGTTTPADPDDDQDSGTENVKTPQQIFEQLQALQQNNAGSGNNANSDTQQQPPPQQK